MRGSLGTCVAIVVAILIFGALCARGSTESGQSVFERRCGSCHALDHAKEGPPLRGVIGRQAGKFPGFPYSAALKAAQFRWDEAKLTQWLTDPDSLVPQTDMAYRLTNQADRAVIVEYLRELK